MSWPSSENQRWWTRDSSKWSCLACKNGHCYERSAAKRHERSTGHQAAIKHRLADELQPSIQMGSASSSASPAQPMYTSGNPMIRDGSAINKAVHHLLDDMVQNPSPSSETYGDLDQAPMTPDEVVSLAISLQSILDDEQLSVEGEEERSEAALSDGPDLQFTSHFYVDDPEQQPGSRANADDPPAKRLRSGESDAVKNNWYPWQNKLECTLDILMHLPRSTFSQHQLDILLWLMKVNNVEGVPSVRTFKYHQEQIHMACGIRTFEKNGALGHRYYINSLSNIIAQEMANPRVRPHLRFYPEENGKTVSEYYEASHWREIDSIPGSVKHAPMAVISKSQYFLYEPCALVDGSVCMPFEWFYCDGQLYANVWTLCNVSGQQPGWVVEEFQKREVPGSHFLLNFLNCKSRFQASNLPSPSQILGSHIDENDMTILPWKRTDPVKGNRWRVLANGAHVLSFPIWLYCDDTSGNLSKKWNKHDSFLFTPSGLPRAEVQKPYNTHFLCTSNLAPPLEMLDGVVEQLESAWDSGIWAWDCVLKERVLMVPSVTAFLGDNPMQSEGHDSEDAEMLRTAAGDATPTQENSLNVESDGGQSDRSESQASRRKKKGESLGEMVERVKRFVKIGMLRNKEESKQTIRSMFTQLQTLENQTKVKKMKTDTGVKDTYLDHFLDRIHASYANITHRSDRQTALDDCLLSIPDEPYSPVWRIRGFDPHRDTPVEILHVILLGFVKYFWCDAVKNQIQKDSEKYELLITRLNSLDVSSLGLSPLNGRTLVQYAGSLVGRDFCAIAQVAPFVLFDLVSAECYRAWVALSNLIPLVWKPAIRDIDEQTVQLKLAIEEFLACTACWSPRWFNKSKFHILLHLLEHVRRFGPAILFATEGFESFNSVIRSKSIHSNHQAPSHDIALAFAHANRLWHLLSGALLPLRNPDSAPLSVPSIDAGQAGQFQIVGSGVELLVRDNDVISKHLGYASSSDVSPGKCIPDDQGIRPVAETELGRQFRYTPPPNGPQNIFFQTCKSLILLNGDICTPSSWVLAYLSATQEYCPCRVVEIGQQIGSDNEKASQPDVILLQLASVLSNVEPYKMPRITLGTEYALVDLKNILCSVNVQHRCEAHNCRPTKRVTVWQERKDTTLTKALISHEDPEDQIINLARMRDAAHFNRWRSWSQSLNMEDAIMIGCTREIDAQKNVVHARGHGRRHGHSGGHGRSGGRGRGHGRGYGQAHTGTHSSLALENN